MPSRIAVSILLATCAIASVGASAFGAVGPTGVQPGPVAAAPQEEPAGPVARLAEPLPTPPATTERVSIADNEAQGNSGSGGITDLVDQSNGDQAISADGRWVAFVSTATNLIPGTDLAPGRLYFRDRQNGTTTAIPFFGRGGIWPPNIIAAEPSVSADGGVVAFTAIAAGTTGGIAGPTGPTPFVLVWDRATNTTSIVSTDIQGAAIPGFQPSVSGDGRYVTYTQWAAPTAAPTPSPTVTPDTTGPLLTNLTITGAAVCNGNQFCIFPNPPCGPPSSATISVTATDPSGVTTVRLWYRYGFSGGYAQASLSRNGDTWSGVIGVGGVGTNQVDYYWEAYDSLGNRSVLGWNSTRVLRVEGCIL